MTAGSALETFVSQIRLLARRFLIVTLTLTGAFCGVLAVVFEKYVEWARETMIGAALDREAMIRVPLVIVTPAIGFAIIAIGIRKFAPRAVGANLARVRMAFMDNPKLLGPRSVSATFIATPLSLGAGAPLGPEGPIVVITSGFSAAIARLLRLPERVIRAMIPVGVAAGIAAIFNAPITGVVFALEEIAGTGDRGLLAGILLGGVAAAVVERLLLGGRALLVAPFSTWHDGRELVGFAVVGVVAGIVSGFAIAWTHRLKRVWANAMPSMVWRAALAGLLIGGAGLIAPSILGVGYDSISFWLHGGGTIEDTGLAFGLKTIAYVIAISGGVLGGSFAPSLFIGTALGACTGHSLQAMFPGARIDPKAYAILGMGSFFAGLLRSPMAAIIIVIELTRDYDLVLPLMLGVTLSIGISRRISKFSIVEQQMLDEGYVESHDSGDPLSRVRIGDAMTPGPMTISGSMTLGDASRAGLPASHRVYPVVDDEGSLIGVLSRETLARGLTEEGAPRLVREVAEEPKLVATAMDNVIDTVEQMEVHGVDRCPVIDDAVSRKVVGFLSPSDILRVRMRRSRRDPDRDLELFE
ncbi:MAG TPA: chloride channel protein [Thermoanaerobaculia bacterium]|jgi:CIC family chloride channel protein|nr:chloride channel protein [Thermoanaerobaculia bacterium]